VRVVVPSDWRRLPASASRIPALETTPVLVFDPAPGLSARALLMVAPLGAAASPSLMPRALLDAAAQPPGRPAASRLDGRRAWSYTRVPIRRGDEAMDVTVLPTTAGVIAVACLGAGGSSPFASDCASAVRLRLAGERALAPSRDLPFRLRLPRVLERLDRHRVPARASLRSARSPGGQARKASRLATAHAEAARELSPVASTPPAARAVRELRRSAGAYQELAAAATAGDRRAFAVAARDVDRADARLARALAGTEQR